MSFQNTDKTKWCSSVWEYTKSFIDSEGYKTKTSITDIDLIAVFQIIANCSIFQNKFRCYLFDQQKEFQAVGIIAKTFFQYYLLI